MGQELALTLGVMDSCVVFDPLDGSSNIDAGVNVGTIFGVYKLVSGSAVRYQDVSLRSWL